MVKKKFLVIGGLGNMGSRYCAILKYLGHDYDIHDINNVSDELKTHYTDEYYGIIIATPTDTHYQLIKSYHDSHPNAPILCEKPISKNIDEVKELCEKETLNLFMVDQYKYLYDWCNNFEDEIPISIYDFFTSGVDGDWDFINIIKRSEGYILIKNKSPVWTCYINGHRLDKGDLDLAYKEMISDFCDGKYSEFDNKSQILEAHHKVIDYIREKND